MMGPTTVAVIAVLLASGANASAMRATLPASAARKAVLPDDVTARGRVHAIEVSPSANGAAVVIGADSGLSIHHFTLENPSRLVIDIGGASLAVRTSYDGKTRGPVRNLRLAQYRADTVRLVIDLDASHRYSVQRDGHQVRIALEAPASSFASWGSDRTQTAVAAGRLENPVAASAKVDAVPVAPVPLVVEPVKAEPIKTEPIKTEPVKTEPVKTVAADAGLSPQGVF